MAALYFDAASGSADLQLLPSWAREDEELGALADTVTAEIVARYTISSFLDPSYAPLTRAQPWGEVVQLGPYAGMVKLADGLYVALKGYAEDAGLAEARFREAMRREIGAVLRWRLPQLKRKSTAVESEADGDTSRTYRADADAPFPPAFPQFLRPFVVEEPSWSL